MVKFSSPTSTSGWGERLVRVIWQLASAAVVLSVPIVLIVASVNALLFDAEFYAAGQARHAIGRTTEYSLERLRPINEGIVAFFRSPGESLPVSLQDAGADRNVFNEREVGHMDDVRDIVLSLSRLQNVALSVLVAALAGRFAVSGREAFRWGAARAMTGALTTLGMVAALGGLTLVDFDQLFLTFHLVSFDNDLWQLDPRRDNLIRFFPFSFWFDATVTVATRTVLSAVLVGVAAWIARSLSGRVERGNAVS